MLSSEHRKRFPPPSTQRDAAVQNHIKTTLHKIDGLRIYSYIVVHFVVTFEVAFQKFCYQCSCLHALYKTWVSLKYNRRVPILHNTNGCRQTNAMHVLPLFISWI